MLSQLEQVALNYATRRSLWLMAAFGAVCAGPGLLLGALRPQALPQPDPFLLFAMGFGTGIVSWVIVTQAKWQFCDPARLLPGYARPHLSTLAAIGLVGFAVFPVAVALIGRLDPLGIAACGIGIGASYTWSMHRPNFLATALALIQFFSLIFPKTLAFWTSARFFPYHVAILVVGWVVFVAWLWRLAVMREEDADYNLPIQVQQGSATRLERLSLNRNTSRLLLRTAWQRFTCDWWHDRIAPPGVSSSRARQRLLNYGFSAAPNWLTAAPMAITFLGMFWAMNKFGAMGAKGPNQSMLPAMNIMFLIPAIFAGQFLAMRRARMPQELQFPLTRSQYFDGLLTAVARTSLIGWVMMLAVTLLLIYVSSPEMLVPSFIVELAAVTGATQVLCFGILTRVSQIASGGKRMVFTMAMIMVATIPLGVGMMMLGHPGVTLDELVASYRHESALDTLGLSDVPKETLANNEASVRDNAGAQFERMQPANPAWIAAVVAITAAAGVAATIHGRNRWLELELS